MTADVPTFAAGIDLYPWQQEALQRWEAAGFRGTMKVVTGAGKTVLGLAAIDRLQQHDPELRVAIVVPTVVLQRQWLKELTSNGSDAQRRSIALLGGGRNERFSSTRRVVIAVLNSATKYLAGDVDASETGDHLLLIVDEVHRAGASVMSRVFETSRAYTLGLSATPERDEFDEDTADGGATLPYEQSLLGREAGPILFELSLAEAIDQGILPPFAINHYGVGLGAEERRKYDGLSQSIKDAREQLEGLMASRGRTAGLLPYAQSLARSNGPHAGLAGRFIAESQERKRLLYRARTRAAAVARILRKEFEANRDARALLFHESIEEVEALAALLEESFPGRTAVEHSKLSDRRRAVTIEGFRTGQVQILVSVRSLIEGFNVPAADVGVIVASSSSVRQRVQTLGRLLRRHRIGTSEEKHSVMHVIYVRDTVDDAIYAQQDWGESTGHERNAFFHYLPPDEPERQEGPPRRPLPVDDAVPTDQLIEGAAYPGRYEGTEYTADTRQNITTLAGQPINAPHDLWARVTSAKGQAGRFVITPRRHHVLVRIREGDEWGTLFVTALNAPLTAADQVSGYGGPTDGAGGEFIFKRSAQGLRIARRRAAGRGLEFAKQSPAATAIVEAAERMERAGSAVTKFRINSIGDAIALSGGTWVLLAQEGNNVEF